MEHDLKLICDAIPVVYHVSLSTQAKNILKGLTGDDVDFNIQAGGSQPTLYAPSIDDSIRNTVICTKSALNGSFGKLCAYIDGVKVYDGDGPYTRNILQLDDAKTITAVAEGTDFNSSSVSAVMHYVPGLDNAYINASLQFSNSKLAEINAPSGSLIVLAMQIGLSSGYYSIKLDNQLLAERVHRVVLAYYDVDSQTYHSFGNTILRFYPADRTDLSAVLICSTIIGAIGLYVISDASTVTAIKNSLTAFDGDITQIPNGAKVNVYDNTYDIPAYIPFEYSNPPGAKSVIDDISLKNQPSYERNNLRLYFTGTEMFPTFVEAALSFNLAIIE